LVEGLSGACRADLAEIEISPTGTGLHWPRLDADLYIPALLQGVFGSKSWMAHQLGAAGGSARSDAKKAAARVNGAKGRFQKSRFSENHGLRNTLPQLTFGGASR
jgi:hypothetical protein